MAVPVHTPDLDWTAERAIALPEDGNRYEVLDGELFLTPTPSWRHQSVLAALHSSLRSYIKEHRLGWMRWSPSEIVFSPRRLLQPDLFVVPWRESGQPNSWADVKSLLLAIEIQSPITAHADRYRKRLIYQSEGVSEYWIIDADAQIIERWGARDERPEILHDTLRWQPRPDVAPLRIDIPELFGEAAS